MDPKERKEYEYKRKRKPRGEGGEEPDAPRTKSEESNSSSYDAVGLGCSGQTLFYMNPTLKSGPDHRPVIKGKPFKPILYKSYCEGSFMHEPNVILGPLNNRIPTIGAVCGKACALAQVAVESTLYQVEVRGVSSLSDDMQLLLRHKLLLGATPCSANGAGSTRGFRPQANFPRHCLGADLRNTNKHINKNL